MIGKIWEKIESIYQVICFQNFLKGLLNFGILLMQLHFLKNLSMTGRILKRSYLLSLTRESSPMLLNHQC